MFKIDGFQIVSSAEDSTLADRIYAEARSVWPAFIVENLRVQASEAIWTTAAAQYQFFVIDPDNEVVALGRTLPLWWGGRTADLPKGFDDAKAEAIRCVEEQDPANTLLAISITIPARFQGRGYGPLCAKALKEFGARHRMEHMILPLRPTLKAKYPLTPIEDYVAWRDAQGRMFDPWLRIHHELGAKIVGICERSMTIEAPVGDWERWAELSMPQTGEYIVAGALNPVLIDRERDLGIYYDPNVWAIYRL